MQQLSSERVTIEKWIPETPSRIFQAWTDTAELRQWFSPGRMEVEEIESDDRENGEWRVVFATPAGQSYQWSGVYRTLDLPDQLIFTQIWGSETESAAASVVTVDLDRENEGTRLVLTQSGFADADAARASRTAWTSMIDKLATMLGG